jgi:hypothetical protein
MVIDKDKIAAYQFGDETVHSACATPEEVHEASQEEIFTDDDLERLESQDKVCFCNRCKLQIRS